MNEAIKIDGLTKQYGKTLAVDDLSLSVGQGEIYGLVGPNGAGKSTTIDILMDYTRPTDGTVTVLGADAQTEPVAVHQRVGILPDRFGIYESLTGRRHVEYIIDSKGSNEDPNTLLERVGLSDTARQNAGSYSKGMQQRLALAMALAGNPSVLVLDEPFSGLDPNGVRLVRKVVREEAANGNAVLFSSHVLGQVELLCDRIGLISHGTLIAEGTITELREEADAAYQFLITVSPLTNDVIAAVHRIDEVSSVITEGNVLRVSCADRNCEDAIRDAIERNGGAIQRCSGQQTTLEDVFMANTDDEGGGMSDHRNGERQVEQTGRFHRV